MTPTTPRARLLLFGLLALVLLLIPVIAYIAQFGVSWSPVPEVWGQFGDFFGGLLNPLYAMLAFFAVLYNVRLQAEQLEIAKAEYIESSRSTQAQLEALKTQRDREELLSVIRDAVRTIEALYNEPVSPQGASPAIQLHHIVHEGWRLRYQPVKGGAFDDYVRNASTAGTLIQGLHTRLGAAADSLAHFITLYEASYGANSPVLAYYRKRFSGLGVLLNGVPGNKAETISFFLDAEREIAI